MLKGDSLAHYLVPIGVMKWQNHKTVQQSLEGIPGVERDSKYEIVRTRVHQFPCNIYILKACFDYVEEMELGLWKTDLVILFSLFRKKF